MSDNQSISTPPEEGLAEPILFVAALMGLKDLFVVFIPKNIADLVDPTITAVVAILIVVGALRVHRVFRTRKLRRLHIFPKHPKLFNPFKLERLNGITRMWPRNKEVARLAERT